MKKEKYIIEIKNKKSTTFRVVIPYKGKSADFGSFNTKDYQTPTLALEAARTKRNEVLDDIKYNRVIEHDMTVAEAYLKTKELLVTNVTTQKRHDAIFYPLVPCAMQAKSIKDISAADIQKTLNDYASKHSEGQIKYALTIWKQIYRVCLLLELPVADRSRMVLLPKSKIPVKHRKKHCTNTDLERFIKYLTVYGENRRLTEDIIYAIRIMQYIGLRPQEAFAVCAEDIDLTNRLLYVQHSVGSDSVSDRRLITTKTPWSVRTLPIPSALFPILADLLKNRNSVPLLVASDGLPYSVADVDMVLRNVSIKSGIKVTLYMLRHNFATEMVKKDIKATQTMMGHESAVMTMKYVKETSIADMKKLLEHTD